MAEPAVYHRLKRRYLAASALIQLVFLVVFALSGAPDALLRALEGWFVSDLALRTAFIFVFFVLWQSALWPVRYLAGWRLEKDFQMLKQSFGGWLSDVFKAQALSSALFIASGLVFYAVVRAWPTEAWWALTALAFVFSAFFSMLFPVCLLPLFYRTTPLADSVLVARLEKALERCGFPKLPIFELKLGEKTARANAMLTGYGRTRRALLSDTLLSDYTAPEIEMVLAHEAGHHARRHLSRSLGFEALLTAAGFGALFALFPTDALLDLRFFPALAGLGYLSGLAALPLRNGLSRAHEKEADRFALGRYPDLGTFGSLMEKLAKQNLANPAPGRWEEFFLYTHPSRSRRVACAEKFLRTTLANSARRD